MLSKMQNVVWNWIATIVAISSYVFLKTYNNFPNVQFVQKLFLAILFFCGLILIVNNILYFKKTNKKYFAVLFLLLGIILTVYFGFILYLMLALQNTSF